MRTSNMLQDSTGFRREGYLLSPCLCFSDMFAKFLFLFWGSFRKNMRQNAHICASGKTLHSIPLGSILAHVQNEYTVGMVAIAYYLHRTLLK